MNRDLPAHLAKQAEQGPAMLRDALEIWWAGVCATCPDEIFKRDVKLEGNALSIADELFDLRGIRRIVVVGAGKASGSMATALYRHTLQLRNAVIKLDGWINAPAGSFQTGSAGPIHLHVARPAGINEPTIAAVAGTERILQLVQSCDPTDLCIALLSGGGSALLAAPIEGITLSDKQQVARLVSGAGGNIQQLNTVRRAVSRVKGGGLAACCGARQMITLIISDVLGDPLETIASGPTVQSAVALPSDALCVLKELRLLQHPQLQNVIERLQVLKSTSQPTSGTLKRPTSVSHFVLANNATAVDAAGVKAVELGYRYIMQAARTLEGDVAELSIKVADTVEQLGHEPKLDCWISGGEPTVKLPVDGECGRGGRNQQLMLLCMLELQRRGWPANHARFPAEMLCMSAGTDGEDGPTPAAGAWFDRTVWQTMHSSQLDAADYARRADAFTLFDNLHSLIISEPTGTNVCDLRIALKSKPVAAR